MILAEERLELEVVEDRLWRSSSKFNTGGPVLKELLCAWRPRGGSEEEKGKPVLWEEEGVAGRQRTSERVGGWGEGCCGAPHSPADRHSVATLSYRLAGPPIERRQKKEEEGTKTDGDPPCWTQ